jgi:hypothetical protein
MLAWSWSRCNNSKLILIKLVICALYDNKYDHMTMIAGRQTARVDNSIQLTNKTYLLCLHRLMKTENSPNHISVCISLCKHSKCVLFVL